MVTHCFNEAENVEEVYEQVKDVFASLPGYDYEHVFIDNGSKDGTQALLRDWRVDRRVKVIINSRNFGVNRSTFHGVLQCYGDAVIPMAADLQDPPDLVPELIKKWEEGHKVVLAVKESAGESKVMYSIRRLYYALVNRLSEIPLIENYYGYGLYDKVVVDALRKMDDPYPYFRGLVMEVGFDYAIVPFHQPARKRGSVPTTFTGSTTWRCWGSPATARCL